MGEVVPWRSDDFGAELEELQQATLKLYGRLARMPRQTSSPTATTSTSST